MEQTFLQKDDMIPGWFAYADDMSALLRGTVDACLHETEPDAVLNIESHFYNVTLHAGSLEYDLDVGRDLWLNIGRWSRLIREYISQVKLMEFIDGAKQIFSGEARPGATVNMQFRDPKKTPKKHRWGGCLIGATFRGREGDGHRPCITFYSRTTYIGYIGLLDAAIAHVIGEYISEESGDIDFRWHLSDMQIHGFKTLPYVFSQQLLYEKLNRYVGKLTHNEKKFRARVTPTWFHMTKWYNKILESYDEWGEDMLDHEKYGPLKRIKRRWMEHEGILTKKPPPSLKLSELTLDKAEAILDEDPDEALEE
jgi:hypothetical protein